MNVAVYHMNIQTMAHISDTDQNNKNVWRKSEVSEAEGLSISINQGYCLSLICGAELSNPLRSKGSFLN